MNKIFVNLLLLFGIVLLISYLNDKSIYELFDFNKKQEIKDKEDTIKDIKPEEIKETLEKIIPVQKDIPEKTFLIKKLNTLQFNDFNINSPQVPKRFAIGEINVIRNYLIKTFKYLGLKNLKVSLHKAQYIKNNDIVEILPFKSFIEFNLNNKIINSTLNIGLYFKFNDNNQIFLSSEMLLGYNGVFKLKKTDIIDFNIELQNQQLSEDSEESINFEVDTIASILNKKNIITTEYEKTSEYQTSEINFNYN